MAGKKKGGGRVYRRADTGEYTTKKYAEKHPDKTVSEPRHRGGRRKK